MANCYCLNFPCISAHLLGTKHICLQHLRKNTKSLDIVNNTYIYSFQCWHHSGFCSNYFLHFAQRMGQLQGTSFFGIQLSGNFYRAFVDWERTPSFSYAVICNLGSCSRFFLKVDAASQILIFASPAQASVSQNVFCRTHFWNPSISFNPLFRWRCFRRVLYIIFLFVPFA